MDIPNGFIGKTAQPTASEVAAVLEPVMNFPAGGAGSQFFQFEERGILAIFERRVTKK
jgi:hypothetical protein